MVKIFVGVTDNDWFDFLSARGVDEVNFWAPSGRTTFRALEPGELFLFKLHSPRNFIVGGGIFSHASLLPLSLAWEAFGEKNGVPSLAEMRSRIGRLRREDDPRTDPLIGCRILTSPFFWPEEQWVPIPESWARNIVVGRGYSTDDADGERLWRSVMDRTNLDAATSAAPDRYGAPVLVRPRLGQGAFRVLVTDAYDRRCAVSGEKTLPILDAAPSNPMQTAAPMRAPMVSCFARTSTSSSTWDTFLSMRTTASWSAAGSKPISIMASTTTTCTARR